MTQWPTDAALRWLESILCERFGQPIALSATASAVTLDLPGRGGRISIPTIAAFAGGGDLPCARWDAQAEGWSAPLGSALPAPGLDALPELLIEADGPGYRIGYDILGLAFWCLCRCEELEPAQLDHHQRFPAAASHAVRHGYLDRPLVDEWLEILGQVIDRLWPGVRRPSARYGVRVSHDVDVPAKFAFVSLPGLLRRAGGELVRQRSLVAPLRALAARAGSRRSISPLDPFNTFDWLMDLSERHGLVSAFYFICGRTDPARDADYEPEHPAIRALLRRIATRRHEIGLHPSFDTYRSPEAIAREADRLREVCRQEGIAQAQWGGRMHYLRWQHPLTLRGWEQAGMSYDSTLGYADQPGFRCGTCHEYPAFDPVEERALRVRIRPLIAMDVTLTSPEYLGLSDGEAFALAERLIDACRAVDGTFTLLWHNSNLTRDGDRALYQRILASAAGRG